VSHSAGAHTDVLQPKDTSSSDYDDNLVTATTPMTSETSETADADAAHDDCCEVCLKTGVRVSDVRTSAFLQQLHSGGYCSGLPVCRTAVTMVMRVFFVY